MWAYQLVAIGNIGQGKLEKINTKYSFVHRADTIFKIGNRFDDNEKICTMRLSMPGPRMVSETKADNFERAIAETERDLDRELAKREENMKN